jgi:hypothetical protein
MPKKLIIYTSRRDIVSTSGGSSIRIEGLTKSLDDGIYSFVSQVRPKYVKEHNYFNFKLNKYELILFKIFNISPIFVKTILSSYIRLNKKLINLVQLIGGNFFLSHQDKTLALILKNIFNIKIIYDIHGLSFAQELISKDDISLKQRVINHIDIIEEKKLFNDADFLNAVSVEMKKLIVDKFNIDHRKFFIVKDGKLSLEQKINNTRAIIEIKNKIDGRFSIGFIGNFKLMGGILNLISAYTALDKENFFFLLIGSGCLEGEITDQLDINNSHHIKRISYDELYEYQQCVDLLICPDIQDNLYNQVCPSSLKIYDSLLSNKRVLSTYFPFWDDLKQKYPNNIYFTDSSIKDIKNKIIEISRQNVNVEKITDDFKASITYKNFSGCMIDQYKQKNIL